MQHHGSRSLVSREPDRDPEQTPDAGRSRGSRQIQGEGQREEEQEPQERVPAEQLWRQGQERLQARRRIYGGFAPVPGRPQITGEIFSSRYPRTMLLHAFTARAESGRCCMSPPGASQAGPSGSRCRRCLSMSSLGFALGLRRPSKSSACDRGVRGAAGRAGGAAAAAADPAPGAGRDRRTPCDPLALQEMTTPAMLRHATRSPAVASSSMAGSSPAPAPKLQVGKELEQRARQGRTGLRGCPRHRA